MKRVVVAELEEIEVARYTMAMDAALGQSGRPTEDQLITVAKRSMKRDGISEKDIVHARYRAED